MWVDAQTNELFEGGVHRCVCVSGKRAGSRRSSPRKRACHGWPLDFQCCADFLSILSVFCCEFAGLSHSADSFVIRTIPGRGKNSI